MKVFADGDVMRYECGFAAETPVWEVRNPLNDKVIAAFRYKKELDEFVGTMGYVPEDITITHRKEIGPVSHALHNVKELIRKILLRTNADDYTIFISGDGNFRDDIATILPYKGNRDQMAKPAHYDKLTTYLKENWNAQEVIGIEADDAMALEQWGDWQKVTNPMNALIKTEGKSTAESNLNTCIATIDKDLDMIPGFHYNWRKDVLYFIDEWTADTWFYCQLIMGDKQVDNIEGIPGKGPAAAKKILWDCDTNQERYKAVLNAYIEYEESLFRKAHKDEEITPEVEEVLVANAKERLIENARLLWMLREPLNEDRSNMWSPPEL